MERRFVGWGGLVVAALVAAVVASSSAAGANQVPAIDRPVDHEEEECAYDYPELVDGVTNDPGGEYGLRVLVLLDGPTRQRGQEVMGEAAGAYSPLDITLTAGYRTVRLEGQDRGAGALIDEARDLLGGHVPHGYDAVHVFTTKDIAGWGLADCIGGIRTRSMAFSVSEDGGDRAPTLTPDYEVPWIWGPLTVTTIAHELGHLMGGQHQLANCVEGPLLGDVPRPCTLMDTSVAMTLTFSTANAAVVRTHAVKYLDPVRR